VTIKSFLQNPPSLIEGFTIGNTKNSIYDGSRLAEEQDVVVVSMK
jgi:hypothetical protein